MPGQQRSNSVTRSGFRVRFDSPVPSAAWVAALDSGNVVVGSDEQLKLVLYRTADRVITDAAFRDQFPAFRTWFQGLVDRNLPSASLGVVCGGRVAEDVAVAGNTMYGVYEGVRVAVSHRAPLGEAPDRAASVHITDNVIGLAVPVEHVFGRQGIMIGNVNHGRIAGNRLYVEGSAAGEAPYLIGVRAHGHFGPRLLIEDNLTEHTSIGVHVRVTSGAQSPHLWQARDNVAPAGTFDIPAGVQQANNVGV